MKTIQKTMGWLVVAAALTITTTACSSDDMLAENNEPAVMPQAPQKVHITVGAGVGTEGKTRSAVDYNSGKRTLKFADGDRLYVRAVIEQEHSDDYDGTNPDDLHDSKIMAGFLTIDPASISADGKSAQFSGDLDIYVGKVEPKYGEKWDEVLEDWVPDYEYIEGYNLVYSPGSHTFLTDDPLAECVYANATLVHAGSEAKYTVDDYNKSLYYDCFVASSVNELMTSSYSVGGVYYPDSHSFGLYANTLLAILNCTISGLTPGASYAVRLNYGDTEDYDGHLDYEGNVAADGDGKATFAIPAPGIDYYYQLVLSSTTGHKLVTLGRKALEQKVYNITATATDYVFPAGAPIVYGTMAWPEDVWGGYHWYNINEDPADVSISGSFTGYYFDIINSGTVTLNNVTAIYDGDYIIYGHSSERDLTVVLTGDNSLSCKNADSALGSDKSIKLRCTGSSATLTLTARPDVICGINCRDYVGDEPDKLAADGYTVALTNTVNGPDTNSDDKPDYVSWTYTVTKK